MRSSYYTGLDDDMLIGGAIPHDDPLPEDESRDIADPDDDTMGLLREA